MRVSIIVLAFNEVESLKKTIAELQQLLLPERTQIILATSKSATSECLKVCQELEMEFANVIVNFQREPFVAAAVLESLALVKNDRVIYMSSDLETPPSVVPLMLAECEYFDWDIVVASRWVTGGSFEGYGRAKYLVSWSAQQICRVIYTTRLTEFTYGFRLYKTNLLRELYFREKKHPFFLESYIIPLRLGAKITEVPVNWKPRLEGKSVVNLVTLIQYLRPLIRVRFMQKRTLRKSL